MAEGSSLVEGPWLSMLSKAQPGYYRRVDLVQALTRLKFSGSAAEVEAFLNRLAADGGVALAGRVLRVGSSGGTRWTPVVFVDPARIRSSRPDIPDLPLVFKARPWATFPNTKES
jgi:hypothetical protein